MTRWRAIRSALPWIPSPTTRRLCNPCSVEKTPGLSTDVTSPLAAIVLAGGASRRMGRDKATLPYAGLDGEITMVEHIVATLKTRCSPVFVIAAPGQALPQLDAEILRDEVRGVGPLLA